MDDVGLFVAELLRLVKERLLNVVQQCLQFFRQIFQRQRHLFAQVAAEHGHNTVFKVARSSSLTRMSAAFNSSSSFSHASITPGLCAAIGRMTA